MDISTGEIFLNEEEVKKAIKERGVLKDNLVKLPPEIAQFLVNKNRKERRTWWSQNKKKLGLPHWNERHN